MCMGLASPPPPQIFAYWIAFPKWVPISHPSDYIRVEGASSEHEFASPALAESKRLFSAFRAAEQGTKSRLRLATERLNQIDRRLPIDAAIDLGVALETLFLSDLNQDQTELTFRLRLRAARFLGKDPPDRKRIFDMVGKLYDLRSKAAHSGRLPKGLTTRSARELLNQGFDLCTEAARRFIIDGEPNWESVQFS